MSPLLLEEELLDEELLDEELLDEELLDEGESPVPPQPAVRIARLDIKAIAIGVLMVW